MDVLYSKAGKMVNFTSDGQAAPYWQKSSSCYISYSNGHASKVGPQLTIRYILKIDQSTLLMLALLVETYRIWYVKLVLGLKKLVWSWMLQSGSAVHATNLCLTFIQLHAGLTSEIAAIPVDYLFFYKDMVQLLSKLAHYYRHGKDSKRLQLLSFFDSQFSYSCILSCCHSAETDN